MHVTSNSMGFNQLEVEMEFESKNAFVVVVKRHNIQHGVNFTVTCSQWRNTRCSVQLEYAAYTKTVGSLDRIHASQPLQT